MARSPMLARWVFTVWGAWLGTFGLSATLIALGVWNPNPILPLGVPILMLAAWIVLLVAATVRLIRGPRRDKALVGLLVGTAPIWFVIGHVLMAMRSGVDLHVPPGWASKVLLPSARQLADLEARWFYPERTPGKWVTMVGATAEDARAQVAAMDRHVDALLARLDQSETWPIVWYRGSLLGQSRCAIYDMAMGSEVGQLPPEVDGLTTWDRHEVAHCVITRNYTARSDPPRVLMEGWAQANQGTPEEELAYTAWDERKSGLNLTLRQLVAPDWYWYSGPAAYKQGAPLVNYLLRVYGPERFLKLYTTCKQATFEADLRANLGVGIDELDAAYWADVEEIVTRTGPPARRWLKGLKLDPSIDPAAWDAFLADYFAAAERMVAPYDHVRLTFTFRVGTEQDRAKPWLEEVRQTLLRSGPFARLRVQRIDRESARLAHPDHSIWLVRELKPTIGFWTTAQGPQVTREHSYRWVLSQIDSRANSDGFLALHGGAVLLAYPEGLKESDITVDFEVARLESSIADGDPLVTLELRASPSVPAKDRQAQTFVFAVDDSYVVRSMRYESADQAATATECQYDHPDGRPVLRSLVTTIPLKDKDAIRTLRLDVEECRFGPIPEAEFAVEPFLASLGPGEVIWHQEVEPSIATILNGYWMAFVLGGISLTGGGVVALYGRRRERRNSGAR
jgi:hypothetical protein